MFTPEALNAAEVLIKAVATLGLELALPSSLPTHLHNVTKKWTRLDQVFISEHSTDMIEVCETETQFCSTRTDHLLVVTKLNLAIPITEPADIRNYREVNWGEFRDSLTSQLAKLEDLKQITNQEQLDANCDALTRAIQATIEESVPISQICSKSKCWWTKELTQMR